MYICKKRNIIVFNNIPDFLNQTHTKETLVLFVNDHGYFIEKLVYNFISKDAMLEMNNKHLNHSTHTDIISFDYTSSLHLRAEIFVSLWAIARSAEDETQTLENETLRVLSHGVLHCMGYNDKKSKEKIKMRTEEERFINMFHVKLNSHV
jgi:probable rRNA maturation factor|tara:strand:+ start:9535 stop:9984 length:450 start_codon:yes stop_codon:yes gene_type:complete